MNHPDREIWVSYLYDDGLAAERRRELAEHLRGCAACRAQLESWAEVRRLLDHAPAPTSLPRPATAWSWVPWAAAAVLLLGLGVGLGRVVFPTRLDEQALRAQLIPLLREQVQRELGLASTNRPKPSGTQEPLLTRQEMQAWLAQYGTARETQRETDLQAVYAALNQLEERRREDYVSLRRDMETVAVLTDGGFRRTRDSLAQLASYPSPQSNSPTP